MAQRTTIDYRNNAALNADLKEVLAEFDLTKTGTVTVSELVAGAEALREVRGQNAFMKKASAVLAVMLVLLLAGMFGVTIMAVELTRETKVLNAQLVAADGSPVQVASSDFMVAPNNALQRRPASGAVGGQPLTTAAPKKALQVGELAGADDDSDFYEVTREFVEELLSALDDAPDTRFVLTLGGAEDGQSELAGHTVSADFASWKRPQDGATGVVASGRFGDRTVTLIQQQPGDLVPGDRRLARGETGYMVTDRFWYSAMMGRSRGRMG